MRTLRRGSDELVELVDLGSPAESTEGRVWAASEPGDFDSFYRRELPRLVVLARVLAGPTDAGEVAQEAMLAALRRWDPDSDREVPAGWLYRVCMHKAASVARRRSLERRVLWQLGSFHAEPAAVAGEDERFWQAVRAVPPRQAQAFALHYALELPVSQVAETLRCAEETVEVQLSLARSALESTLGVREVAET